MASSFGRPFYLALAPVLALTIYCAIDPDLHEILGLAWDAGAVTTGPVTVPLVLSLGIGISAAAGRSDSGLPGFGIVTLASLLPILGVMLLAIYVASTVTPAEIIEAARLSASSAEHVQLPWYQRSPGTAPQQLLRGGRRRRRRQRRKNPRVT